MSPNYFFVSKFIILTFIDKFFHFAYFDRQQWFLAGTGGFSRQNNFLRSKLSPFLTCPNYFCLQIYYLDFYLQAFFYFAYYDRKQWFLVGSGGFSGIDFFSVLLWTYLQIFFVFCFTDLGSLTLCFLTFLYYFITLYLAFIT